MNYLQLIKRKKRTKYKPIYWTVTQYCIFCFCLFLGTFYGCQSSDSYNNGSASSTDWITPTARAATSEQAIASSSRRLADAIQTFNNDPTVKHTSWGFYAKSIATGKVLAAYNENKSLTPASTLKALTTATALAVLGEDFTFQTQLAYDGTIDKTGTLQGNLYIIGGGDPTLASNRKRAATQDYQTTLSTWVEAIQKAGIQSVNGRVIGDEQFFTESAGGRKWLWEDVGNYYGAEATGLNFHENFYSLIFKSGRTGWATTILGTEPEVPNLSFVNQVRGGKTGSGDGAYIFGGPYIESCYVSGTISPHKSKFYVRGAVPDPALLAADALSKKLLEKGIHITTEPTTVRRLKLAKQYQDNKRKTLMTNYSPPLSKIVYWTNKKSINLFAESLLKMMGKKKYGKGDREHGLRVVKDYWVAQGLDLDGLIMEDGSGLSPTNAITPKQLTQALHKFTRHKTYNAFYNSLAVAGEPADDGMLKSFMRNTSAAKKIRAKSGFISHVRAYTGYAQDKAGKPIAFTFMVNNYTCSNGTMKKKIQNLLKTLAEI